MKVVKFFSPTIEDLIERSGKSQRELAKYAGISEGRLSNYKAGRDDLNGDVLAKLSKALNVSLGDLALARQRSKPPEESQALVIREESDDAAWMLSGQTDAQLFETLKRVLDEASLALVERCRRAQILFDEIKRRAAEAVNSAPASGETVLLRKAGAESPHEPAGSEPTPGADAPSVPASGRPPVGGRETKSRPRPPAPAPGNPAAED